MKIDRIGQLPAGQAMDQSYQLIVAACGYESRARAVAEKLRDHGTTVGRKVALCFSEHKENPVRKVNDKIFTDLGYELPELSAADADTAARLVTSELLTADVSEILIDISSMTRAWYGGMISALMRAERTQPLVTRFIYVPAEYCPPVENYPPNEVLGPVDGFASRALPDKPTALVIGLGYDRDRALGLKDYLDPQLTLLFFADPGDDARYLTDTRAANKELFETLRSEYCFAYPLADVVATYKLLESACRGLLREWRVVLCSLGPKPFGLICFLLASYYRDISIWRMSAGGREETVDHVPGGEPLVFEVEWSGSNVDTAVRPIDFDELVRRQMVV